MMGVMSGSMQEPMCYGVKLVSLFPGNPEKGLSGHRGAVVLFEAETGGAVAMMDAGLLTAIRTAAASGVATRALARAEASKLTIIGTGEQAEHHLAAMLAVRPITSVHIVGRRAEKAAAFAAALKDAGAKEVWLAGRPGAAEAELKAAGVDAYLFMGGDLLEALAAIHRAIGV